MRVLRASLILAVFLALLPAPASADDWGWDAFLKRESPWKGHGVGSYVTETTTTKLPQMPNIPNMPNVPGMPKDGKMVSTVKTTLKQVTDTGYVLEVESTSMGRTTRTTRTEPKKRSIQPKATDGGTGTVDIEGTSYPCAIKNVANMDEVLAGQMPKPAGPGGGAHRGPKMGPGKVYVHEKLGVLRIETTVTVMGQPAKSVWQVTKLAVSRTVGTVQVTCREMTITMTGGMMNSTMTILVNPSIPGTVRSEMESKAMGHSTTSVTEITAYVKKAVTTGG